jgi:hypothetical protein
MSKRNSEYRRKRGDLYQTPVGPLDALKSVVELPKLVWECADGGRHKLVKQLIERRHKVVTTNAREDFLSFKTAPPNVRCIVTNPPFGMADLFIEHAIALMWARRGMVAMLLPSEFDHARRRSPIFRDCLSFAGEVKLLRRIVWFKRRDGVKEAPSENHSWYVWDHGERRAYPREPWVRYATWHG